MCFSGRSLYTYERSLEKFGVRKKKFCRNSSARIFYSQYYSNVELRSVRLPLKVTESKIVVSSLFEILPMWLSLLNDRHRKRRIPLGASTKLPETRRVRFLRLSFDVSQKRLYILPRQRNARLGYFRAKTRNLLRRCTRKKHEEEESSPSQCPRQMEVISFASKLLYNICARKSVYNDFMLKRG